MEAILNVKLNPQLDTSKLSGALSGLGDNFTNSVNNFAKFGLMKQGIEATAGAISNLTSAFVEYDKELRIVRALGVDNFTEVDEGAKNLAKTMGISVVDAMKMFGNAVGSGTAVMDGNNVVLEDTSILLEGIAKGAVAGGAGMEEYSKSINAILNGFGAASTEVGKFNDMIFQAANVGVGTGNEFATAMAQMAGSSKAAGIDVEVLAGSLATLSLVEPSVSQSQTKLARLFNTLQAPSKELSEAMDTLGLTMADFSGDQMIESLSKVREYMDDTGKSAVEVFGSAYSASAFLTLTNDIEKSAGLVNTFYSEAAGTTEKAYDLMSNSVANKLDVFNNKIKNAKEKIGEFLGAGGVQLAGMASTAMKELGDFGVAIGGIKNIVSPFGNLLKKLFPDLLAVGAGATTAGAGATTGAVGFSTLAGAVGSALVPLLPFIAAGVAIAGLVVLFWNWDEAMEKLSKTLGISATTLDGLLSVFKLAALPVFYITNLVKGLTEKWVSFDNFIQVWKNRFTDAISGAKKWVTDFIDVAVTKFKWLNPVIEVVKETVANMKNNFYYLIAVVKEVANAIGNFAKSVGGKIGEVLFGTKSEQDKAAQQLEKNAKKAGVKAGKALKDGKEEGEGKGDGKGDGKDDDKDLKNRTKKVYEDLSSFYQSVKSLTENVQTQYIDIVVDVDKSAELKRAEKELKSAHEVLISLQDKYNETSQKIASKNVTLADKNALKNELQTIQTAMVMQRGLIESYADNIVEVKKKEIHKREENVEAVDEEIVAIKRLSEVAQSTYIPLQVEATELTLPEFEKIDFKFDFASGMGSEADKARKALETQLMLGEISVSDYNKKLNDINSETIDNTHSMLAQVAQGLTAMTSDYLQQSKRMLDDAETSAEKMTALSQVIGATMMNTFAQSAAEGNSFIKSMVLSLFEALKAVVPVFVAWITGLLFSQMGLLGVASSAVLTALLYAALSTAKSAVASASFWAGGLITAGSSERKDTTYAKVAKYEYVINRDATLANLPLVEELNSNRGVMNWNNYFDKNPDVVYNYISKKPVTAFYNPNGIQSSLSSLEERVGQIQAVVERLVKTNSPSVINNSIIREFLENQVVKTIKEIISNNYIKGYVNNTTTYSNNDIIYDCIQRRPAVLADRAVYHYSININTNNLEKELKDTTYAKVAKYEYVINRDATLANLPLVEALNSNRGVMNWSDYFDKNPDVVYNYISKKPVTAFYNPNGIQSSLSSLEERVGQIQAVVERLVKNNSPSVINNSIIREFLENQVVKNIKEIISNSYVKKYVNNTTTYSNNDIIYDYIQRRPAVLADRAVYHYSININTNNLEKELKDIKETMYIMKDYMNASTRRHINIHGNVTLDRNKLIQKIEFEQNILRNK